MTEQDPTIGLTEIVSVCDRFEVQWIEGDVPDVGVFLNELQPSVRSSAICHLLDIDRSYRQRHRLPNDREFYVSRLDEYRDTIKSHLSDVDQSTMSMLPDPDDTVDSTGQTGPASVYSGSRQRLGEFEIIEVIAKGGMGIVYRARDLKLDRVVALKMILTGDQARSSDINRFFEEARAVAALEHPNIVPVYNVGEIDGQPYFSMAYVDGQDLSQILRQRVFDPMDACQLVKSLADALNYSHQNGVIHRDIKPGNILLTEEGDPKLTDFGLAKRIEADQGNTIDGTVLGTPAFMPPEQARGKIADVKEASDIYSLGATLYCMLTGRPPFQADKITAVLHLVCEQEPITVRTLNPSVPIDLESVVHKCLEKDVSDRYRSADQLRDDLDAVLKGEPTIARPLTPMQNAWKWCKRKPLLASLAWGLLIRLYTNLVNDASKKGRPDEAIKWLTEQGRAIAECDEAFGADKNLFLEDRAVHSFNFAVMTIQSDSRAAQAHAQESVRVRALILNANPDQAHSIITRFKALGLLSSLQYTNDDPGFLDSVSEGHRQFLEILRRSLPYNRSILNSFYATAANALIDDPATQCEWISNWMNDLSEYQVIGNDLADAFAQSLIEAAEVSKNSGDHVQAAESCELSISLLRQISEKDHDGNEPELNLASTYHLLSRYLMESEKTRDAISANQSGLKVLASIDDQNDQAVSDKQFRILVSLGKAHVVKDELDSARSSFADALESYKKLGDDQVDRELTELMEYARSELKKLQNMHMPVLLRQRVIRSLRMIF